MGQFVDIGGHIKYFNGTIIIARKSSFALKECDVGRSERKLHHNCLETHVENGVHGLLAMLHQMSY